DRHRARPRQEASRQARDREKAQLGPRARAIDAPQGVSGSDRMATLVLLPGMHGSGELFADFVAALGAEHEAIAITYPKDQPLGYARLESIVRSELPSDRSYVLLGESFSGPIALSIAASAPCRLRGLILCGSFAKNPMPFLGTLRHFSGIIP